MQFNTLNNYVTWSKTQQKPNSITLKQGRITGNSSTWIYILLKEKKIK